MNSFIQVNSASLPEIKNQNWTDDFSKLHPLITKVPQVKSGGITEEQVTKWLTIATQQHDAQFVKNLIRDLNGLNSSELLALYAFRNDEYHPQFGASEVYGLKRMELLPIQNPKTEFQNTAKMLMSDVICQNYGLHRETSVERRMSDARQSSNAEWFMSSPDLIVNKDGRLTVIELGMNDNGGNQAHNDFIMNYHHACALDRGVNIEHRYRFTLNCDESQMATIVECSGGKRETPEYETAKNMLLQMVRNKKASISIKPSAVDKNLYIKIMAVGTMFNRAIQMGVKGDFTRREKFVFSQDHIKDIEQDIKNITSIDAIERYVKAEGAEARSRLLEKLKDLGVDPYTELPIKTVTYNASESYDLDNLYKTLVGYGVDKSQICKEEWNTEALLNAATSNHAAKLDDLKKYEQPDKDKCIAKAMNIGLDLSAFRVITPKIYNSGQTRGPEFEARQPLRELASELTQEALKALESHSSFDHKDLRGEVNQEQEQSVKESISQNSNIAFKR